MNSATRDAVLEAESSTVMSDKDYLDTQTNLTLLGSLLELMDIDGFLGRITMAEAAGPAIDPTLYRVANRRLSDVKRMAECARTLRDVYLEIYRRETHTSGGRSPADG